MLKRGGESVRCWCLSEVGSRPGRAGSTGQPGPGEWTSKVSKSWSLDRKAIVPFGWTKDQDFLRPQARAMPSRKRSQRVSDFFKLDRTASCCFRVVACVSAMA